MTNFIKDQIAVLIKLQSLDNKTRTLQSALKEVDSQVDALDGRLLEFEKTHDKSQEQLDNLRKAYRDYDREVQNHRSQIEKSQDKTRSVKTNKEYQSLLKEIDDLKKKASSIEDNMLEILEQIDGIENDVAQQSNDLKTLKLEVEQEKEEIYKEAKEKKNALAALANDRVSVEEKLAPEISARFNSVKAKVGHVGIVPVKKSVCQGCHLNIPPQLSNEMQRYETLLQCPNCQRIIYYYDVNMRSE